jgi:hypothetical protein
MCGGMVYNHIEILTSTVRLSGFRIFGHDDEAGQAAAERWMEQLKVIATGSISAVSLGWRWLTARQSRI